ncbi:hypothetical protein ACIBSV_32675 [Embleya sp. NPDC050154]|uniref:hypothetical protein n=1 Tax=unclassified Embleya TaxID=2699296 RepID=UPI0037B00F3B
MFRTPTAAAPITVPATDASDAFSVVDVRTATTTGMRISAAAAAVPRVVSPAEPPRPRHRREARITAPRPAPAGRRAATSSGYRPR